MYQIILHRRAVNFYNKSSDKQKNRISKAIDKLEDNPLYDKDVKKLRGKLRKSITLSKECSIAPFPANKY